MKIIVNSEREKEQLRAASVYFHDLSEIDTDYNEMVNIICHLYRADFLIEVKPDEQL